jgi:hypothetical protein
VDSIIQEGLHQTAERWFDEPSSSEPTPLQPDSNTPSDASPQQADEVMNKEALPLSYNETLPELAIDPLLDQAIATGDLDQYVNFDPIRV